MKSLPNKAYGLQLLLDGYGADHKALGSVDVLYHVLLNFPKSIGMRRIGYPHIIHVDDPEIKGLSGFVFLMESHVSIHTYELQGFITADVYSCKHFDTDSAVKRLEEAFGIEHVEAQVIVRGKSYRT